MVFSTCTLTKQGSICRQCYVGSPINKQPMPIYCTRLTAMCTTHKANIAAITVQSSYMSVTGQTAQQQAVPDEKLKVLIGMDLQACASDRALVLQTAAPRSYVIEWSASSCHALRSPTKLNQLSKQGSHQVGVCSGCGPTLTPCQGKVPAESCTFMLPSRHRMGSLACSGLCDH